MFHLTKSTEKKKQIWDADIEKLPNGHAILKWEWGQEGGKIQKRSNYYEKGKVKRSAYEQALLECKKMVKDKLAKGYISSDKDAENLFETSDEIPQVMLAFDCQKYKKKLDNSGYIMPKLDGIFCIADLSNGKLYSRSRNQITGLPHIENAVREFIKRLPKLKFKFIVGELYKHGWGFQKISGLVRRTKNTDQIEIKEIEFHVFDAIANLPFYVRFSELEKIFEKYGAPSEIVLTKAHRVSNIQKSLEGFHKIYTDMGYEGIMIHPDGDTKYENKRTDWLLKYKKFIQEEFVCIGFNSRKHHKLGEIVGSVLLVNSVGNQFSATPKWTDAEKRKLHEQQNDYLGKHATVKFFAYTETAGVPRFPILIGFRDVKDM